ncbi:oxygen-insensitive NADPH nitroreductase [Clostridium sp. D2Q-14]|uniref:oxygen-insensitive NADPH nitroreductase n=1 Tax=Anaeromonas gelatinilytica TaxID=2683194 RepID=UPI00193BF542|nr:oxygen-insensitive NADPH nitroreductase [Anaeromonas gelatinilytica]MBS4534002.1 oxygen-insensitive NADPH nitroreductase [Anaeromonas gelatinilytica]
MNETIRLIHNHRSIRKYTEKPIEEDKFKAIIEAGQMASSSSFIQGYTVIRVKNKENRKKIAKLAGDQPYIEEAPEFLMFCADLNRVKFACEMQGVEMKEGYTESFIIATVDTALMAQNVILAAESLGITGVYIGGERNNPKEISEILELPKNVYPVFGMCLGYPRQDPILRPRLPYDVVLKEDRYSIDGDIEKIQEYDEKVRKYYIERTKGKINKTWTEQMAQTMNKELRPHMRKFLKEQGFEMK